MDYEINDVKNNVEEYINAIEKSIEKALEFKTINNLNKEEKTNYFTKKNLIYDAKVYEESILEKFDFEEFTDLLNQLLNIKDIKLNFEWPKYNSQYKNYFINSIENFKRTFNNYKNLLINNGNSSFNNFINISASFFQNIKSIFSNNSKDLFEIFKYGDKNYVIFGKNGSGKTTLLHNIRGNILNQNSFVISAKKKLSCNQNSIYQNERTTTDYNSILSSDKAIDILCVKLLMNETDELRTAYVEGRMFEGETITLKFYNIFDSLNLERKIKIENENLYLYDDDISPYSLSSGSDGEKVIASLIMTILLLPSNAYIFIDEPENHLNGSLMIELYNKLEETRKDLKFIYLTHNIDFIESRTSIDLVYLEKTREANNWKFKKIDDFDSIGMDIIMKIEGTKKPLLFCEGDNNSSIDYQIYSNIYKDYAILPISSCEKVSENVKAINGNCGELRRIACGILDNDFKEEHEVTQLRENKLFVLKYNEIESLLLKKCILEKVDSLHSNKNNINEICDSITNYVRINKSNIFSDFLTKAYRNVIKSNRINYNDSLEVEINNINEINKVAILKKFAEFSNEIEKLLDENKYDDLIKIIPGKFVFKSSIQKLGFKDEKSYVGFIVNQMQINNELKEMIKSELPEIE